MCRNFMQQWSGAFGKRFIGEDSPFATDYDALGEFTDGRRRPIQNLTRFPNPITPTLLFAVPVDTAVVMTSGGSVLIAQVEAAEENWSFSDINPSDFEQATFDPDQVFQIELETCTFAIFDSAYDAQDIGNDLIEFEIESGSYLVNSGTLSHRDLAELNLFKLEKLVSR